MRKEERVRAVWNTMSTHATPLAVPYKRINESHLAAAIAHSAIRYRFVDSVPCLW